VGRFHLVLVTHDESMFYKMDQCKTKWVHETKKAAPEKKDEMQSVMVSAFITSEWGLLRDDNE